MIEDRTRLLIATVKKLFHRNATVNIKKIFLKTHTADIALVLESFDSPEVLTLLGFVDTLENKATILSYLNKNIQKDLVELMPKVDLVKLAKLMESDDLADLLGQLKPEQSEEILNALGSDESEEVSDLMGYPEDSAGGIMNSDHFSVDENYTVEQTIQTIQNDQETNLVLFYLYVINSNGQLVGVLSLKQLLLSEKKSTLKEVMFLDVISVTLGMDQEDVAKTVEHYDFLSLPVVDGNNKLVGVVTVDDVIDVIRAEAEEDLLSMGQAGVDSQASIFSQFRARIPWLALSFLGGIICFVIIHNFIKSTFSNLNNDFIILASMVPIVLGLSTTAGSQAATTTLGALRSGRFEASALKSYISKELTLSLLFSIIFGGLVLFLGLFVFSMPVLVIISLAISIQIIVSIGLGCGIPLLMDKINLDPMVLSVPFFTIIADIMALLILFGLY